MYKTVKFISSIIWYYMKNNKGVVIMSDNTSTKKAPTNKLTTNELTINELTTNELTTIEGIATIAGTGIGSGVMAIPYLFHHAGITGGILALITAYILSIILHFLVADIIMNTHTDELTSAIGSLIIKGPKKKFIRFILFVLVFIMLTANLSAYISGGAEIIASLFNIGITVSKLIFCIIATIPILFGLKAIGRSEKYLISAIFIIVIYFTVVSITHSVGSIALTGTISAIIATFSMTMFSMTAIFAVPQMVSGVNYNKRKVKISITGGLTLNIIITALICLSTIISSKNVTEMAAVGWSESFGSTFRLLISIFVLLAMLTSFFALAYSLSAIISGWGSINIRLCFIISSIACLLVSLIPMAGFSELTRLAGGIISLLVAILIVPAYYKSEKINNSSPIMGRLKNNYVILGISLAGTIMMTIGSLISI